MATDKYGQMTDWLKGEEDRIKKHDQTRFMQNYLGSGAPEIDPIQKRKVDKLLASGAQNEELIAKLNPDSGFVPRSREQVAMDNQGETIMDENPGDWAQQSVGQSPQYDQNDMYAQRLASMAPGLDTSAYKRALMGQANLASQQADERSRLLDDQNQRLADEQDTLEQKREADEQYLASQRQVVESKQKEYNSKPANIAQMFAEQSTGGKVMTAIALFLGSAPSSSGQNTAVKVMQDSINADLDKQESEIEGQKGIYNELKLEIKDKQQARAASYETILEEMKREIGIQAAQHEGPTIQKNAQAALALIDMEQQKLQYAQQVAAEKQLKADRAEMASELDQDVETEIHVDTIFNLLEDGLNTGQVVGNKASVALRKLMPFYGPDVQSADYAFKNLGLKAIAAFAKEAGARSIDSDTERAYLEAALPDMSMDEDVLRKKLLVVKGLAYRKNLLKQYSGSDVSPFANQKQIYNLKTGEVMLSPKGQEIPSGFVDIKGLIKAK